MEMEMEMEVGTEERLTLNPALDRLAAAAMALEQAAARMALPGVSIEGSLDRVSAREAELEERLTEAEATIASLRAEMTRTEAARPAGRRTEPFAVTSLVAREGSAHEAGALDAALRTLSIEQRIVVKAEMMRAGLLG